MVGCFGNVAQLLTFKLLSKLCEIYRRVNDNGSNKNFQCIKVVRICILVGSCEYTLCTLLIIGVCCVA